MAIDFVDTHVKVKNQTIVAPWPVMFLSLWLKFIVANTTCQMIFNNFRLEEEELWCRELESFWALFECVQPTHAIYQRDRSLHRRTIPFCYHGDEGRGKVHRAVLVLSYQPALQRKGHSFLTRLLASVIPAEKYACANNEETLETIHKAIAADLLALFEQGIEVPWLSSMCAELLL